MSLSKPVPRGVVKPNYRAVMGCYIEVVGESEQLYGVTCEHVTKSAVDALLYIQNTCKEIMKFGEVLDRQSPEETIDSNAEIINYTSLQPPDIDIFKITSAITKLCKPVYRNASGKVVSCRLFRGNIEDLYGKTVFQCSIDAAQKSDQATFRSVLGEVSSFENHQRFAELIDLSAKFIVRGKCEKFATRGDSGRIVAVETGEDTIEVIGIILAGDYTGKETGSDDSVCICLLLEKGLEYLSKEYGKKFTLSVSEDSTEVEATIEPGCMILYYNPTNKVPDIDLVKQLTMLIDCLDLKVTGTTPLETIAIFETDLNRKVYQREDLAWKSMQYPTADQTCIHQALLACEYVYSGKLHQAEKCLKKAYSMIRTSCFRLRLLCRVYTYSAWLMLETNNIEQAGQILESGIPFMEGNKSKSSFPNDCLGYQYYDYSRYLQKVPGAENNEKAKVRALQAIRVFEDDHRNNAGSTETLALAYANYAHLLLGFDEHFENVNSEIEDYHVNAAKEFLDKAEDIKGNNNSVEEIYILNAWGEYHFRKEEYGTAMGCFEKGMNMAESMKLTKEKGLCSKRLNAVRAFN